MISDMMRGVLKYSKSSENLAVKCLALAEFCKVEVSRDPSEEAVRLSLQLGGGARAGVAAL